MRGHRDTSRAFTIVEVLVVIGLISVMMILIMPAMRRSMSRASSTVCMHNLREIGRSLHEYRMDHRGLLPDVDTADDDGYIDPEAAAWYGRLVPRYVGNPSLLVCPSDPARSIIDQGGPLSLHTDPANASSYGMNSIINEAGLSNLDRRGPTTPLETILLADMGPDIAAGNFVRRNNGWLPWDDGFHPGFVGLHDSWLTGRHFGHINVLTIGGVVRSVRTAELMEERIRNYYGECSAGGCSLCNVYEVAHYSFASARVFWWTGLIHESE